MAKRRISRKGPRDGASERGFKFDAHEADRRVAWFPKYLRHYEGEWGPSYEHPLGMPFELAAWQRDRIVRPLFGWKRPDGLRRYRVVYCEVPKKAGKSTFAAGLALMLLCADGEPGAQVFSAAADRDQARYVFDAAVQMVASSPAIAARVKVYKSAIVYEANHSVYRVISSRAATKHGANLHGVIFDELHAQPNRELWDALKKGRVSRRQPILMAITNSGWDRKSICWEQHDYAEKVRDGIIPDDTYLPVLYNAPKDCNPFDEAVWAAVNPGLGTTVKIEALREEAMEAKHSPVSLNTFRRLHLGQWTESETRWIDMDRWASCGGAIQEASLEGRRCFGGLDLSTTTDLSALALLFAPLPGESDWPVLMRFWCPEERIMERARRDNVPYDVWRDAGWLTATEGNVVDYDVVRRDINALAGRFEIVNIARDRWNASQITTQLMGDGIDMVDFGQGYASMSPAAKELDALYRGDVKDGKVTRKLRHGDNPILTWNASNAYVQQDAAGNIKPSKEKSGDRIDGIVALAMATGMATADASNSGISVYVYDPSKATA